MRGIRRIILAGVLAGVVLPPVARGDENRAAARIEAMVNFLAKAPRLGVIADCSYDVLQDSGQKIEFGERRELTLRRPDRAHVTRRDGARRGLLFDGQQLTAFDLDEKVYATIPKPGTVDAAFAYFAGDLAMRLPLRELFASDLPQELKDALGAARLVGEEKVDGIATDHVAFRGDTADVQLWIPRDGDPLPQRIVIGLSGDPRGRRPSPGAVRSPTNRALRHPARAAPETDRGAGSPGASAREEFPPRRG